MAEKKEWKDLTKGEKTAGIALLVIVVLIGAWIISSLLGSKNTGAPSNSESARSISNVVADIQGKKSTAGVCMYEDKRSEYATAGLAVKNATTNFVNLAKNIDFGVCDSFQYSLSIPLVDSRGNEDMSPVLSFVLNKENKPTFDKYNWDNLKHTEVYDQLNRDGIIGNMKLLVDGIEAKDVQYTGASEELK